MAKKKSGVLKEVDGLLAKKKTAAERIAELEKRVEALEKKLAPWMNIPINPEPPRYPSLPVIEWFPWNPGPRLPDPRYRVTCEGTK